MYVTDHLMSIHVCRAYGLSARTSGRSAHAHAHDHAPLGWRFVIKAVPGCMGSSKCHWVRITSEHMAVHVRAMARSRIYMLLVLYVYSNSRDLI